MHTELNYGLIGLLDFGGIQNENEMLEEEHQRLDWVAVAWFGSLPPLEVLLT